MEVVHDRVENTLSCTISIVKKSQIQEGSRAPRDLRFDIKFILSIYRLLSLQHERYGDKRAIRTSVTPMAVAIMVFTIPVTVTINFAAIIGNMSILQNYHSFQQLSCQ